MSQDSKNGSSSRNRYYLFTGIGVIALLALALYTQSSMQGKASVSMAEAQIYDGSSSSTNNNITREISVVGTASRLVKPDKASLNLGVETQAETASKAARMNSEIMNKVIDAITALGIEKEKIGTNYYAIFPVYEQRQREDKVCIAIYPPPPECYDLVIAGYKATNSLIITLNADADIGRIIDTAVSAGANQVYGVNFFLSQELQSSIVNELMEQAAIDAKNKAEKILTPLGAKLGDVKNVNIYYNPPVYATRSALEAQPTPVFPQQQEVFVSVNVTFMIEGAE